MSELTMSGPLVQSADASLYAALDLTADASPEEISAAYERLSAQYDPARWRAAPPEVRAAAAQRYAAVSSAYATLHDPTARAAYDERLEQSAPEAELDYRPLSAAGTAVLAADRQRWRWLNGWVLLALGCLLSLAGTAALVWAGLRPPQAQQPANMPLFAALILQEIPDQRVRDQLLSLDAAAAQAQAQVRQDPRSSTAWTMLGNAHYDFIQTIYEQAPDGQAYALNLDRWQKATEAYTEALQLDPFQPTVRSDLALAMMRYGAGMHNPQVVAQGFAEAQRALRDDNQTPQVLVNVGRAFALADPPQPERARELWQQVLTLVPNSPEAALAQRLLEGANP